MYELYYKLNPDYIYPGGNIGKAEAGEGMSSNEKGRCFALAALRNEDRMSCD